jgi:hypothetical protein
MVHLPDWAFELRGAWPKSIPRLSHGQPPSPGGSFRRSLNAEDGVDSLSMWPNFICRPAPILSAQYKSLTEPSTRYYLKVGVPFFSKPKTRGHEIAYFVLISNIFCNKPLNLTWRPHWNCVPRISFQEIAVQWEEDYTVTHPCELLFLECPKIFGSH